MLCDDVGGKPEGVTYTNLLQNKIDGRAGHARRWDTRSFRDDVLSGIKSQGLCTIGKFGGSSDERRSLWMPVWAPS